MEVQIINEVCTSGTLQRHKLNLKVFKGAMSPIFGQFQPSQILPKTENWK